MNIIIITGAGISAPSGIPTFRGNNGMWNNETISKYLTKKSIVNNLIDTCKFYDNVRKEFLSKEPNVAHFSIAKLEECKQHNVTVITQNIDTLHEKAGSKNVIHMHGNITKLRNLCDEDNIIDCYGEQTDYSYRPHIVFFDESILELDTILSKLKDCELYISIGTSDNALPASAFVTMIPPTSKKIQVNLQETLYTKLYNNLYKGPCEIQVPLLIKELL